MNKLRVLIVDDSVVIRRVLREVVSSDPELEVAGVAANGAIALSMIEQVNPDLVTLDVEMPVMDGLEALAAIRAVRPSLPVIMFSTLTVRGAAETIEALTRGATDYVTKPSECGNLPAAIQQIRSQLIPKIKALRFRQTSETQSCGLVSQIAQRRTASRVAVEAVVIGTSTGGPNALAAVIPHVPAKFPVPILIVQHMPPLFTRFLADRLADCSNIRVAEACGGEVLEPGCAWMAPGNYHLTVVRETGRVRLMIKQDAPENSCRPSVDVLFRSAAEIYGPGLLALVMTGMGQDGLIGCQRVKQNGGRVLVQDEATSVVWGMPGFVAKAGLADKILPLQQIGSEIVRVTNLHRAVASIGMTF
ncbi:MAG TPA: chemotaxis response regulator protein-glutamate methylesterase [Terriglobales bacterium]|nr:chemotaxis response regulator protein-glutamate methylesterase [Terriglobales bacterium]